MQRPSHGGNLLWASVQAGCTPQDILDFSASINPLGPPSSALQVLNQASHLLRHYPDPNCGVLKTALSHYHDLPEDWMLPGNGAAELLTWAGRDMSQFNGGCSMMSPGFKDYSRALSAANVACVLWPVDVAADRLSGQTLSATAGCILNDPHNPSGKRLSPDFIGECLSRFKRVVIDEAFLDFLPPDQQHSAIALLPNAPNLIVLRSLTKFYSLPGLRIGYAIAHPRVLARWQHWRDPWSVNALALEMGAACIQDTAFQNSVWAWLPGARSHLLNRLQQFPALTPMPSVANFILVRCRVPVTQLQEQLLKNHRILIRDCMSFPELGDHYFRVAVLQHSQSDRLVDALAQELPKL